MAASINTIEGIGPQAVEVFMEAGFHTIQHLVQFDAQDRRLWDAVLAIKARRSSRLTPTQPDSYWRRLFTRCINIIYRARSVQATDFVPHEFMCPITLDWYEDPVVTASGVSYSRHALEEHFTTGSTFDPVTRIDLGKNAVVYDNIALRHVVEHYRMRFQRYSVNICS